MYASQSGSHCQLKNLKDKKEILVSPIKLLTPDTIAPPAGPYSHTASITIGDVELIFVAGEWSTDIDGNLVGEDDMFAQTEQTLKNIQSVLEANGASFEDVFKMSVYVTDMDRRQEVSDARKAFLPNPPPISSIFEISKLALPGLMIEIEAVAAKTITA